MLFFSPALIAPKLRRSLAHPFSILLLCALACNACAHLTPQSTPAAPPVQAPASAAAAAVTAAEPWALGIFSVQMPRCLPATQQANAAQRRANSFCAAATRAIHRTYQDDSEDAAPLLALLNQLEIDASLQPIADAWQAPLRHALRRSHWLQRLGPSLRLLRAAVADAYLDPRTGLYRGVDARACSTAFAALAQDDSGWEDLVITIEPLGSYPLGRLRRFCLQRRQLP